MSPAAPKLLAALCTAEECGLPRIDANAGTFNNILGIVLMAVAAMSVGFMVYGGLRYVVSAGSPEETRKAKDIVVYSVVGLVVALLAFVGVRFVVSRF